MTTTVKRGAGRPAAQAKADKAAQRPAIGQAEMDAAKETPAEEFNRLTALPLSEQTAKVQARIRKLGNLPENTGVSEVERAEEAPALDKQTAAQLLATARGLGLSPSAKTPKAKLIELLKAKAPAKKAPDVWLDDVVAQEATDKPPRSTRKAAGGKAPATAPTGASKPASGQESQPGAAKVTRLTEALEPFGWEVTVKTSGERIEATAERGTETLRQVWVGGSYDYNASIYKDGEKVTRKVRNLSEAIRLGSRKPEVA